MTRRNFNAAQDSEIRLEYESGLSAYKLAAKWGGDRDAIENAIRRAGGRMRTYEEARFRRWRFREDFFSVIDNEEKAYWLGFITADGYVNEENYVVQIGLAERDKGHLIKLSAAVGSDRPIRDIRHLYRGQCLIQCMATLCSKRMVDDLKSLGVRQRKSFTSAAWVSSDRELMRHYWRGVIDGDGSIGIAKKGHPYIELVGSFGMVSSFREYVTNHIVTSKAQVRPSKSIYTIMFGGNIMAPIITRHLYEGCSAFLDRKKAVADAIMSRW